VSRISFSGGVVVLVGTSALCSVLMASSYDCTAAAQLRLLYKSRERRVKRVTQGK
jgi:hypothetical protein